jgi:hypothetical protein
MSTLIEWTCQQNDTLQSLYFTFLYVYSNKDNRLYCIFNIRI